VGLKKVASKCPRLAGDKITLPHYTRNVALTFEEARACVLREVRPLQAQNLSH
jgi:hypothetical protein